MIQRSHKPYKPILPLLAFASIGGQCVWSTEMAFASPFLLHLGMSKSAMAIVLMAGPISGFVVQPTIGLISDKSRSQWGRRRPMLLLSCLLSSIALLQLGFSRPIAALFTANEASQAQLTIIVAVLAIFFIDFTVNAVNALARALLLDLVPSSEQSLANAWSARLAGGGSILGFLIGQADLTTMIPFKWFPSLSSSARDQLDSTEAQLRCVCILVALILLSTHAVTMLAAQEQPCAEDPSQELTSKGRTQEILSAFRDTMKGLQLAVRNLSLPIWHIFRVQFFMWIAWFPILFYGTAWVGAIAKSSTPSMDSAFAIRLGSLAMLYHASLSIVGTALLPSLVQRYNQKYPARSRESLTGLWSIANFTLGLVMISSSFAESSESINGAMMIIALTGFAWALSTWAPYALLGIVVQKEAVRKPRALSMSRLSDTGSDESPNPGRRISREERMHFIREAETREETASRVSPKEVVQESDEESEPDLVYANEQTLSNGASIRDTEAQISHRRPVAARSDPQHQSGTILGLHNLSLVIPQFITTVFCTIIFSILEPEASPVSGHGPSTSSQASPHPFTVVLQIGGISAFIGSYFAVKLARQHKDILEG